MNDRAKEAILNIENDAAYVFNNITDERLPKVMTATQLRSME